MLCQFPHVAVKGIAAVVPPRVINIDDEIEFFQHNPKKLARAKKIVGYGTRHVVDEGVTAVDLCEKAARNLIQGMGESFDSLDTLILVNQSPDHFHPSGSCILHGRLGLVKTCATLDIALGCSGYVYGLWLAHSLIASGASRKLLLLAGDTPSRHTDRRNRLVNPLFGDAGTATLLCRTEDANTAWFHVGSDGTGWHHIAMPAGGFRLRAEEQAVQQEFTDTQGNPWKLSHAGISGMDVFDFTLHEVPASVKGLLEFAGKECDAIDFFALHQANKQIVQAIGSALGLPDERVFTETFSKYGNQSTAYVACVLCHALQEKEVSDDVMTLLLSGFGVGLSWASALVQWRQVYNDGIRLFEKSEKALSQEETIEFWKTKFLV